MYGSLLHDEAVVDGDDGGNANSEEEQEEEVSPPVNFNTRWAADRTHLAADRTAIAWVRTAISMIGFGVTISKAADLLKSQGVIDSSNHSLTFFGIAFVAIALLGLILVIVQNIQLERRMVESGYGRVERVPLGLSMTILVLLVAILGVIVILTSAH